MTSLTSVPIVTLRDMVVYPHGVQPLFIGTEKSIRALDHAQKHDAEKRVLLVAKRDPEQAEPGPDDLYAFGTVATILQLIRLPDKTVKILSKEATGPASTVFRTVKTSSSATSNSSMRTN
jgi:ATP-dependent Lon protease